jgi:hypothetical protein
MDLDRQLARQINVELATVDAELALLNGKWSGQTFSRPPEILEMLRLTSARVKPATETMQVIDCTSDEECVCFGVAVILVANRSSRDFSLFFPFAGYRLKSVLLCLRLTTA